VRVLFATPTWHTHFFNLVPLAWALQTAGHEVRVACEPELIDTVTRAGLTAVPIGSAEPIRDRARRAEADGTLPTMDMGRLVGATSDAPAGDAGRLGPSGAIGDPSARLGWDDLVWLYENVVVPRARIANDTLFDGLVEFARWWRPQLVVWDGITLAGPVAAGAVGAAHAQVSFTVGVSSQLRTGFLWAKAQQPADKRTDPLADWLGSWTEKFGYAYSEDIVNGHTTIDQFPASLRLPTGWPYLPMRYVPYNGSAVLPDWLTEDAGVPRVVMTLGLSMDGWEELQVMTIEKVQETLDAVADLDIELVLTLPPALRDRLDRIPGNTRVVPFAPLNAVLPTSAVLIHHGGAGTFFNALLFGMPQLMICKGAPDVVQRRAYLDTMGAGISLAPDEASGEKVREALGRLLDDPSFRAGGDRIRAEMLRQPAPNDVVPELEKLAARHGRDDGFAG
jgi:glycosyltransferase (activator-dependent family)